MESIYRRKTNSLFVPRTIWIIPFYNVSVKYYVRYVYVILITVVISTVSLLFKRKNVHNALGERKKKRFHSTELTPSIFYLFWTGWEIYNKVYDIVKIFT